MPRRSSLVVCGGIVVVVFCVGSVDAAARGGGDENRIKGSRRNSVQPPPPRQLSLVEVEETSYESHNLPQHDRKTGGLLRVFDQVWSDTVVSSSAVQSDTFVSSCVKPKKKKGSKNGGGEFSSETRATGGSGKSGGGKSGGSSSSSSDSSSSSSSSSGGGKGKKGKKGGSSGDSAVRICEGYDEDGNLIGSYPTASVKEPPPPPPSPSSDILLVPSAPSTPSSSVVNDAPTSTPNTFISDDNNFVGQESVCRAFEAGTAPTAGPRQSQTVQLTLNVVRQNDTNSNRQAIYNRMDAAFKTSLAPLLLNCASDRRLLRQEKRQLQTDNSTEYVNIVFGNMTQNTNVNCTPTGANSVCFPSQFQTDLYFFGDVPESFGDQLKQAILFWDFNIDELLGFGDVQVTETVVDTGDDEEDGDVADEDEDGGTPTPGPGTRDVSPVDGTVTGIDRSEGSSNRANPGAFVAAAVAFLTLVLVALFIVKRHRYHVSSDSISKHLELTDDDIDMGNETDDNTAMTPMPPPLPDVYVVGDDESYIANRSSDGHEVYRASLSNHPGFSDIVHHGPNEQCSSPNCQACEAQRQSGTRFVGANAGTESPVSNSDLKPREYEADDTVSL